MRLERQEGIKVAIFSTAIQLDHDDNGGILNASAAVALDGSATRQLDASMISPEIMAIRARDGSRVEAGDRLALAGTSGEYEIIVTVPEDCAVTVDAEVIVGGEA